MFVQLATAEAMAEYSVTVQAEGAVVLVTGVVLLASRGLHTARAAGSAARARAEERMITG